MLRINIRDWEVKYGNSILIILQSLLNILAQNIHLTDSVKRFFLLHFFGNQKLIFCKAWRILISAER